MLAFSLALWIIWWLAWIVVGLSSKHNSRRETLARRLHHFIPLATGVSCIFVTLFVTPRFSFELSSGTRAAGLIATVIGLAIACWARIYLGRNWSGLVAIKEDHELVARGPYRYVRHPIYTGIILSMLGSALTAGTAVAVAGACLIVVAFVIKLRHEEEMLEGVFGWRYTAFKKLVPGRLIPWN
jgi:protein-S-isoprenylcysteine O-methyltransferase Ste14